MGFEIRIAEGVDGAHRASLRALAPFARRTLADLGRRGWDVGVLFVDDPAIRDLNRRWRRIDRATDVLSFPAGEGLGPARVLGDIAISVPRAVAQAKRYRVPFDRELQRLLVHGILHLMGYDHKAPAERRTMRALERRLLGAGGPRTPRGRRAATARAAQPPAR